jgi:hypothetical protein
MLLTTPLAFVLAIVLVVTDLVLSRWRSIPVGRRAWWLSAIAPPLVGVAYAIHRPGSHDFGPALFAALILPIVGAALVTRWVGGTPR